MDIVATHAISHTITGYDVSIANPQVQINMPHAESEQAYASRKVATNTKNIKCMNSCNQANIQFVPLIFETFGSWH